MNDDTKNLDSNESEEQEIPGCIKIDLKDIKAMKPNVDSCYEICSDNQISVDSSSNGGGNRVNSGEASEV